MRSSKSNTLDELLQMSLNEDVFERILGMLEQEQHKKAEKISKTGRTAPPQRMPGR